MSTELRFQLFNDLLATLALAIRFVFVVTDQIPPPSYSLLSDDDFLDVKIVCDFSVPSRPGKDVGFDFIHTPNPCRQQICAASFGQLMTIRFGVES